MEFNATFLATIISFIIFVFLMNKILYAPILNIMQERKNYIDENYKTANENKEKTEVIISEIEERKNVAKNDARTKYDEILDNFKEQKNQLLSQAQQAMKEELEKNNAELTNTSNETKENLKGSMINLANDIVEKIIGYKSEIQGFDNEKINEILYK
ncbi:MAG: ATP synthase F0 subunit B [Candidatus Gastranaerophilales bacterium]|nr:ATP synthase F0 subunit B [Candidatus Gastranaerophilales bacterium]